VLLDEVIAELDRARAPVFDEARQNLCVIPLDPLPVVVSPELGGARRLGSESTFVR
jgi:hypothetical protein